MRRSLSQMLQRGRSLRSLTTPLKSMNSLCTNRSNRSDIYISSSENSGSSNHSSNKDCNTNWNNIIRNGKAEVKWDRWEYGTFKPIKTLSFKAAVANDNSEFNADSNSNQRSSMWWESANKADIEKAINTLADFALPERFNRLSSILENRTNRVRFLFENPVNVNNIWAAGRTLDSFGVQYIDIILDFETATEGFLEKQKRSFAAAMGTQKWLSVTEHPKSDPCIADLKKRGYRILVSDVNAHAKPIHSLGLKPGDKVVMVLGNEKRGVSEKLKAQADDFFYLPMRGFAESFNLSVAAALSVSSLDGAGLLEPHLEEREKRALLLEWLCQTVAASEQLLQQSGIHFGMPQSKSKS